MLISLRSTASLFMGDAKPGIVMANRDRELLIPVGEDDNDATPKPSSSSSSHNAGQEVIASFYMFVLRFRVSIAKLLMFLSNLVGNILVKG